MALTLPNLDDRRWSELTEEGRALIPFYAPEWTDHNIHDPGITLMELFAWLAEMDVYHLNRVTERNKLKFLSLVGIHPEPPRPALTVLGLTPKASSTPVIPAGVEFEGVDASGMARFSTLNQITVLPVELQALLREEPDGFHDLTSRWRRGEALAPFGDDPRPGATFYLGFHQPLPVDTPVTLFFVVRDLQKSEAELRRIVDETISSRIECSNENPCLKAGSEQAMDETATGAKTSAFVHHSVRLVWEYFDDSQTWQPLDPDSGQITDETRALTLNGRVVISVGAPMGATQLGNSGTHYFLRCSVLSGAFDAAPMLKALVVNGVLTEQSTATGELQNIQTALGTRILEVEQLGTGTGTPNQQLALSQPAAVASSFELFTGEEGLWRQWTRRPDFDASGRADAHFLLDPTTGIVRFGDGERGRAVPLRSIVIASYRTTRAEEGNLVAASVRKLAETRHNQTLPGFDLAAVKQQLGEITNPVPAVGGSAAESVVHAEGRAFESVAITPRAATLEDYDRLARETPGTQLARVLPRANSHNSFPCITAAGIVTVVILPFLPKGRPSPSPGLRQAVAAYLGRRRVIGTRIEVVAPIYREVSVRARVQSCAGVNRGELRDRLVARLNEFFDPLVGGPDHTGWVLGRDVYRSEVLQAIDETVGVDHAVALELIVAGQSHCGNICLSATELVVAGQQQIEVM
jgi:predicted phage baseplate assembly protein